MQRDALLPPPFSTMPPLRKAWEAFGGPVALGVACGLLLTVSAPLYVVGVVVSVLGGVGSGAQHDNRAAALSRAVLGGVLFGAAILLGYELAGAHDAKVELPDPTVLLLAATVIPALPLHLLGWRLGQNRQDQHSASAATPAPQADGR